MEPTTPSVIPSYVTGLLRTVGGIIGGYLIGKGYITAEQAAPLAAGALALVGAIWTIYSKNVANKKLKVAIAAPAGQAS